MKYLLLTLSLLASCGVLAADRYKLSYEQSISDTRKVCVYVSKDGQTIQKEQAKGQYCRTVL
jgi:hypothetical protein